MLTGIERFLKNDAKQYEIINNKDFLTWLSNGLEKGYKVDLSIEGMQIFINKLADWYQVKFTDSLINISDEKSIRKAKRKLTFDDLDGYLSILEVYTLYAYYQGDYSSFLLEDGFMTPTIIIDLTSQENEKTDSSTKNHRYTVEANVAGEIVSLEGFQTVNNLGRPKNLINLFRKLRCLSSEEAPGLDINKLHFILENKEFSEELRSRLLYLVAIKLLYSEKGLIYNNPDRVELMMEDLEDNNITTSIQSDVEKMIINCETYLNDGIPVEDLTKDRVLKFILKRKGY